jgi:hypothetical protein
MTESNTEEAKGGQAHAGDDEEEELQAEQESAEAMDADVPHESTESGEAA